MRMLRVQPDPINMVGPKCIPIGMNCLADTQDTSYQYSYPLPLGKNIVYAVVGTLGTRTNNATYVGLGLTSTIRMLGFDNRSDADLEDSASDYAPAVNNTEKFFVYYFTRDCSGLDTLTGGHCLEISDTDLPPVLTQRLQLVISFYLYGIICLWAANGDRMTITFCLPG